MTTEEYLTAVRRLLGEAVRAHPGAEALDDVTRAMLRAASAVDEARRELADPLHPRGKAPRLPSESTHV